MKPVFGNAATSAPKAASFKPTTCGRSVTAIVNSTTSSAHGSVDAEQRPGRATAPSGVLAPKRNSMHGSAKYSTKAFSPGIAASGSSMPPGGEIAAQHQREEGNRDGRNGLHRRVQYRMPARPARPAP